MASKTWDDAAGSALARIYENKRENHPTTLGQLRKDLDEFIDELFYEPGNQERARVCWAIIGANALEIAALRQEPLDMPHVHSVLVRKQRDYGPENIRRFGRQGLLVRMHDKVARLENLLQRNDGGGKPENESITDNLLDVVGYASVGIMWESDQFLLPLKSPAA